MIPSINWRMLISGISGFVAALMLGWILWSPGKPSTEPPAPAQRQTDGSLVLERTATTVAPPVAPHVLPAGAKEERRVHVVVQPPRGVVANQVQPVASSDHVADAGKMIEDSCDCPPVQVDLSLVRMPDKGRRVVASSPTGTILSGLDIPIEPPTELVARRPWAAGITFSSGRHLGGFIDRDLGPFRLGVEAFQAPTGWTAQGRVGIRF